MNTKLILILIIISGTVAVFGQSSKHKGGRYTLTGCRPAPAVRQIPSGGVLNNKATSLPEPVYPPAALAARVQGQVGIQVFIDEQGDVVSASAVSGPPLLRASAVRVARKAKFPPTRLSGQPVKVSGILLYKFSRPPRPKLAAPVNR